MSYIPAYQNPCSAVASYISRKVVLLVGRPGALGRWGTVGNIFESCIEVEARRERTWTAGRKKVCG